MIGKPQSSEVAPYYFTYIDQVTDGDIVQTLSNQLEPTLAFCSKISEEKSLYRYAADKWSIRQTLSHVADAERLFAFRAFWFARGFDAPLPSFDQNIAVASAGADAISW